MSLASPVERALFSPASVFHGNVAANVAGHERLRLVRTRATYRLSLEAARQQVRELMAEHPIPGEGRFGCYLIADSSPYSDAARAVEASVFAEWFGDSPATLSKSYAPYEEASKFLLVVDRESQEPAGVLRFMENSESGLRTLNDISHGALSIPTETVLDHHQIDDLNNCWDVSALAVLKKYRARGSDHFVSTALYGLFYAEVCKAGIEHVVAVLDKHAYSQLTELLGIPFTPIANSLPFEYLGIAGNRAAYFHVPDAPRATEAHLNGLEPTLRELVRPHLARMCGEGLPQPVEVW